MASSTFTPGQTRLISSFCVTISPGRSASAIRISSARLPRRIGSSSFFTSLAVVNKSNGPKESTSCNVEGPLFMYPCKTGRPRSATISCERRPFNGCAPRSRWNFRSPRVGPDLVARRWHALIRRQGEHPTKADRSAAPGDLTFLSRRRLPSDRRQADNNALHLLTRGQPSFGTGFSKGDPWGRRGWEPRHDRCSCRRLH